jgi:plastocyanin
MGVLKMKKILLALSFVGFLAQGAFAEDAKPKEYTVAIKDHVFVPAKLAVAAGEKFNLIVDNQDKTPEEFESHDLSREKVIKGGTKAVIKLGPLEKGEYKFFGEFHEKTAQGVLVVK